MSASKINLEEFKNETLFHVTGRLTEEEARRIAEYAIRMGWAHPPAPAVGILRPPKNKKLALDCEQFRSKPVTT